MTMYNKSIIPEDSFVYDDDGGAAKGDHRRLRRQRNQLGITSLFLLTTLVLVLIFCFRSERTRDLNSSSNIRLARSLALHRQIIRKKGDEKISNVQRRRSNGSNNDEYYRWADPRFLPPIPGKKNHENPMLDLLKKAKKKQSEIGYHFDRTAPDMKRFREGEIMDWELDDTDKAAGPTVDFTSLKYEYPELLAKPPPMGQYPPLESLGTLLERWPQNDIDHPPQPFVEKLLRFDYSDPKQREISIKFRDLELPFKVYNVPELDAAKLKWTDEYVSSHFDGKPLHAKQAKGHCQESVDEFFCFFKTNEWVSEALGPPPTMDNDFTFERWAKHARYADRVGLHYSKPHFYWQVNIKQQERFATENKFTFISKDLPSFSSTKPTYFSWKPKVAQGIQCRFGERGVAAATHYDGGRNMIGMITGAKRYILAAPNACGQLGLVSKKGHPIVRHSVLNFAHINLLKNDTAAKGMSNLEREWLEIASSSLAVETVLKAGEVLYVPSHWFHYIVGLQKSAQCNVRSGAELKGSKEFGGYDAVKECR